MYVCMYIGLLSFLSFLAFKLTMDKQVTMKKDIYIYRNLSKVGIDYVKTAVQKDQLTVLTMA